MGKLGSGFRKVVGAPFRALLPRNPWLRLVVFAIPLLIILAFLEPVLGVLGRGFDLLIRIFEPLLDNPVGRLVLLNVMLLISVSVLWIVLRSKIRGLRSGLVLRNHLEAVNALVASRPRTREQFRRVARSRAMPPSEYPEAAEDAKLKLARIALERGDCSEALAWLARVREKTLPKQLLRSLAQLRAEAYLAQGEVLPESLEQDLRKWLDKFSDDTALLAQLRRVVRDRGDLDEAVVLQEKVLRNVAPRHADVERQRLVDDLIAAANRALEGDQLTRARKLARRARSVHGEHPAVAELLGQLKLAERDVRGAVREWGASNSPEGLRRLAELLDRNPGCIPPRELLELAPAEGTLLLVAREYARAGDHRKAMRAARRAARALGPTPTVTTVLAEVLQLCGKQGEAEQITQDALLRLVSPE